MSENMLALFVWVLLPWVLKKTRRIANQLVSVGRRPKIRPLEFSLAVWPLCRVAFSKFPFVVNDKNFSVDLAVFLELFCKRTRSCIKGVTRSESRPWGL